MYRLYNTAPPPVAAPKTAVLHTESWSTVVTALSSSFSNHNSTHQIDYDHDYGVELDNRSAHSQDDSVAAVADESQPEYDEDSGADCDTVAAGQDENERNVNSSSYHCLTYEETGRQLLQDISISEGIDVDALYLRDEQNRNGGETANHHRARQTPQRSRTAHNRLVSSSALQAMRHGAHPLRSKSADYGDMTGSVKPPARMKETVQPEQEPALVQEPKTSNQQDHASDPHLSSSSLISQEETSSGSSSAEEEAGTATHPTTNKPRRRQRPSRVASNKELPVRTKSVNGSNGHASVRRGPLRAASTDGSTLIRGGSQTSPRRRASRKPSGGVGGLFRGAAPKRTRSLGLSGLASRVMPGRGHRPSTLTPDTELNLFGASDMISTDFLLAQIAHAKEHAHICRLEVEDFLDRNYDNDHDNGLLPLALRDLFLHDDRPWELVHFVDEIHDGLVAYKPFTTRKATFWNHLGDVLEQKVIPYQVQTKVHVTGDEDQDTPYMVQLLRELQNDPSVTVLHVSTCFATQALVRALTDLFQCDERDWKHVALDLSGQGPSTPGTSEHDHWTVAMQTSTANMQRIADERGIRLV